MLLYIGGLDLKADKNTENEIIEMLNRYARAYADKDLDAMINLFLEDPDIVAIGTGEDEWVHGYSEHKEGFKRDITQSESIKVDFNDINVSAAGAAAWMSSYMTMYAHVSGEEIILRGRLTAVFEKVEDKWYFVHLHYSLPAVTQEIGESFPK
jgi:ketosteroid isomerase-like protein